MAQRKTGGGRTFGTSKHLTMDGLLFDPQEFTDAKIRETMANHYCRQCGNKMKERNDKKIASLYCRARESGRTKNGFLKVKSSQPACIMFTKDIDEK